MRTIGHYERVRGKARFALCAAVLAASFVTGCSASRHGVRVDAAGPVTTTTATASTVAGSPTTGVNAQTSTASVTSESIVPESAAATPPTTTIPATALHGAMYLDAEIHFATRHVTTGDTLAWTITVRNQHDVPVMLRGWDDVAIEFRGPNDLTCFANAIDHREPVANRFFTWSPTFVPHESVQWSYAALRFGSDLLCSLGHVTATLVQTHSEWLVRDRFGGPPSPLRIDPPSTTTTT